jgi:hypothetical protein
MENNLQHPKDETTLIIDLTIKSFLVEINKGLKMTYITGFIFIALIFVNLLINLIWRLQVTELSKSLKIASISIEIYQSTRIGVVFWAYLTFKFFYDYSKSLKSVLISGNQDDLIESFYKLKVLFRWFAFALLAFIAISFFFIFAAIYNH